MISKNEKECPRNLMFDGGVDYLPTVNQGLGNPQYTNIQCMDIHTQHHLLMGVTHHLKV